MYQVNCLDLFLRIMWKWEMLNNRYHLKLLQLKFLSQHNHSTLNSLLLLLFTLVDKVLLKTLNLSLNLNLNLRFNLKIIIMIQNLNCLKDLEILKFLMMIMTMMIMKMLLLCLQDLKANNLHLKSLAMKMNRI